MHPWFFMVILVLWFHTVSHGNHAVPNQPNPKSQTNDRVYFSWIVCFENILCKLWVGIWDVDWDLEIVMEFQN